MLKEIDITWILFAGILSLLFLVSIVGQIFKQMVSNEKMSAMVKVFNERVGLWWAMCGVFTVAAFTGGLGSIIVFGLTSFLLLREFITITPTRKGDHHTLFWVFFIILPLQYFFLLRDWYGMFIILIPVYAFLFIPLRIAITGETHGFMERTAKIQWALMICIYCISHAPALLKVDFPGEPKMGLRLLLFLCLIVQTNDITQRVFSYVHRNNGAKLVAGLVVSTILGASLWWATPFSILQSAAMAALIVFMGTAGNFCYAAMVQDRNKPGVVVVQTRQNVTERVISLCFAAPVFFHIARYYFTNRPPIAF
ncbi:MAG: phosphatidate cytidylyltransferase [Chlamydiae bacterium]|nr:MAG: phosphatidate cytidylyltransferase [Chlamydiota bacterium]